MPAWENLLDRRIAQTKKHLRRRDRTIYSVFLLGVRHQVYEYTRYRENGSITDRHRCVQQMGAGAFVPGKYQKRRCKKLFQTNSGNLYAPI